MNLQMNFKDWWRASGFQVPPGYDISLDGVIKLGKVCYHLTTDPVWVNSIVANVSAEILEMEIAWGQQTAILSYADAFQKSELQKLASVGFPLIPTQLGRLTDYFACFLKTNRSELMKRHQYLVRKPGWAQLPTGRVFGVYAKDIIFTPPSTMAVPASHLHQNGSLQGWLDLRPYIQKAEMLSFFIAAALAAPVLDVINASGFCVDQFGQSGTGKTTTLRICASIFGKTGGQTGDGLVAPWHATPVFIEEMLAFFSHLPLFCMDSQDLAAETVELVAYIVANGQGKGRGAKDGGIRMRNTWKSVLLSDGEASIYDRLSRGGAKARVISIHGAGCTGLNAKDIEDVNSIIAENYGVLAPVFIQKLIDVAEELPAKHKDLSMYFNELAASPIARRVAGYFGIIATAASVLRRIEGFEWFTAVFTTAADRAWDVATLEIESSLPSTIALQQVADWVISRQLNFTTDSASAPVSQPCFGRIEKGDYVAFLGSELKKLLTSINVTSPNLMLKDWLTEGSIDGTSNYWTQVKIQGERVQAIRMRWSALFPNGVATTNTVTQPTDLHGLSKATGRLLELREVVFEGIPTPFAVIEGAGLFIVEPAATDALANVRIGRESADLVTILYKLALPKNRIVAIDGVRQVPVSKPADSL